MPEAESKVKWCLRKAENELSKSSKHRGLIKTSPDSKEAAKHLSKAQHNFKALLFFEKNNFSDWSASAGFYTIYHCFLAIAKKYGYESRNQECTVALMQALKEKDELELGDDLIEALKATDGDEIMESNVIELRENYQYGTKTEIEDEKLLPLKELCKKALRQCSSIIFD